MRRGWWRLRFWPVGCAPRNRTPPTEPTILSVHPLGARADSTLEVEVQGNLLEGARAVWFEQGQLQGRVEDIRPVSAEETTDAEAAGGDTPVLLGVRIRLEIPSTALTGVHRFRLVSRRGVSNALMFRVNSAAVLDETSQPHQTPSTAQQVSLPAVVNGRVASDGEEDFYAFEVTEARELRFEVFSKPPGKPPDDVGLDPELTLYEPTGSWFDKERTTRLAYNDDPSSYHVSRLPRLTYRFRNKGRYLVGVGSFLGGGSPSLLLSAENLRLQRPHFRPTGSKRRQPGTPPLERARLSPHH